MAPVSPHIRIGICKHFTSRTRSPYRRSADMLYDRECLQLYTERREAIERSGLVRTWARKLVRCGSLAETTQAMGAYFMNTSIVAALLGSMSASILYEVESIDFSIELRTIMSSSGWLATGALISCTLDCILIDNSLRKLRTPTHFFRYMADHHIFLGNPVRLLYFGKQNGQWSS